MSVYQDGNEYVETALKITNFGASVAPRGGYIEGVAQAGAMAGDTVLVRLNAEQYEQFLTNPDIARHQPETKIIHDDVQDPEDRERLVTKVAFAEDWSKAKPMTAQDIGNLPVLEVPLLGVSGGDAEKGYHVALAAPDYEPRFAGAKASCPAAQAKPDDFTA